MKRRRRSNRVKISFIATILALTTVVLISYSFSFRTPTYSIPSNLPPYGGPIGRYGPSDSLQVVYDNYTGVRLHNASAIPNRQEIRLSNPTLKVNTVSFRMRLEVTLLHPNDSATVAFLDSATFSNLTEWFTSSKLVPDDELGFALYHVNDSGLGRVKPEWMTLVASDSAVVYSEGTSLAKDTLLRVLSVRTGGLPSILSLQNVTRMLYAIGGTGHLAVSIQNFPTEVLTNQMGLLAVDVTSGRVSISHVVRFATSDFAASQISRVKAVYIDVTDVSQYEECVKGVEYKGFSSLQGAVHLAD